MRIEIKNKEIVVDCLKSILTEKIEKNFNGISIDSRQVEKGDIFIATKGERAHGNDFINQKLLDKVSLIISDENIEVDSNKIHIVDDSKMFIKELAIEFRKFSKSNFIGITGTNGKTSTKELLVKFLETKYRVSYSRGNYNSTISLPLSILEFDIDSDYCVLEIGASQTGEIKSLCDISNLDYGLITNISEAHLTGYNGFQDLINTKMDLYRHIAEKEGSYFLNIDDENIKIDKSCNVDVISFSCENNCADYYADISDMDKGCIAINEFLFKVPYKTEAFTRNFLASYSIADSLGVAHQNIQKVLDDFVLPKGRGEFVEFNGIKVINDTYNANLDSMIKGVGQLANLKTEKNKIAVVIADMLELSSRSIEIHQKLGEYLSTVDFIDGVYAIGNLMKHTIAVIDSDRLNKKYYKNKDGFVREFKKELNDYGIIYLKGSRGMYLETVIEDLFDNVV